MATTGQLSNWVSFVGSATLLFPSNGRGGTAALIVASTAGTTVYTATTVSDTAPWSLAGVVVGDYIFTSGGFYGTVRAIAAPVVTVDQWRLPGIRSGQIPANGTQASVFAPTHLGTYTSVAIDRLIIATTTGGAVVITDQKGTAYPGMSFAPASGDPKTFDFGPPGLQVNAPFGVLAAAATSGIIMYRPLS